MAVDESRRGRAQATQEEPEPTSDAAEDAPTSEAPNTRIRYSAKPEQRRPADGTRLEELASLRGDRTLEDALRARKARGW